MTIQYFDEPTETAPADRVRQLQLKKLRSLLAVLLESNAFYSRKLASVGLRSADEIRSLADLQRLPFTTKHELVADQQSNPLFGTNLTYPLNRYVKYHQTSGTTGRPLRWLDTDESWQWWLRCWGAVYRSAGVGPGDRVFFAFGFGPFIGFWSAFESARLVGAMSIPGGGMSSEQRLQAIMDNQATVLVCTPTYALYLAEVAQRSGIDLAKSPVRVTIHAGEPGASIPSTRQRIEEAWGARCFDHTGATEVGATGFSCAAGSGVHLNEAEFIFEVLDPLKYEPAPGGGPQAPGTAVTTAESSSPAEGELVVTNLGRYGMPVVRYRLGDVVRLDSSPCDCKRTFARLSGGVIGRADDMVTVRGVNVFPTAIENIIRQYPAVVEFTTEVVRQGELDELNIKIEAPTFEAEGVCQALQSQIQRQLSLRPNIAVVPAGTLPRFELKARRFFDRRPKP